MSKRICERCKSENLIEDTFYGGTRYYLCVNCLCRGDKESFPKKTLFHQITSSLEVLAEKFVEKQEDKWDDADYAYYSYLTKEWYATESEAIAATVAKLKEQSK